MYTSFTLVIPFLLTLLVSRSQATTCNATNRCPETAPCCSEYGYCGTDNFCLGGCNPLHSHTAKSCKPMPNCLDETHPFTDLSGITKNYNGDPSTTSWTVDSGDVMSTNSSGGELVLTLSEANMGTRVSSVRYIFYGTITVKAKTGRWNGVVSAFITMSGIKDEIDWEFPGNNTDQAQTNFFWQGFFPVGSSNGNIQKGLLDTYSNYHDYTINWQPDRLEFIIDGQIVRTVYRADTKDASGVYQYPSTPSRIQLSLWPAGIPSSHPGTIQWAGGMINWQDPDYVAAGGHFYLTIDSVTIKCADSSNRKEDVSGYTYDSDASSKSPTVNLVTGSTMLDSSASSLSFKSHLYGLVAILVCLMFSMRLL